MYGLFFIDMPGFQVPIEEAFCLHNLTASSSLACRCSHPPHF